MKLNRLETHDRLLFFKKDQAINVDQGAEDCLKKNELCLALKEYSHYVYLFAHPRTADDGVTKRLLWQPRLTRPLPQTNSYLFRADCKTHVIETCWILPIAEVGGQYKEGTIFEDPIITWSIDKYTNDRHTLAAIPPDDLPDEVIRQIYNKVYAGIMEKRQMEKMAKGPIVEGNL